MAVTKVVMPKLSEAMETGKLLRWLKQEGEAVSGGDIIAEIETDKADIELEAFGSGVLRRLLVGPGTSVPVGNLIAVIAEPDEDIAALVGGAAAPAPAPASAPAPGPAPASAPAAPAPASPDSARAAAPTGAQAATAATVPAAPSPSAADAKGTPAPPAGAVALPAGAPPAPTEAPGEGPGPGDGGGRLRVSPLARKLAQTAGVDLEGIKGTGPGGRIVQRDVDAVLAGRAGAVPAPAAAEAPAPARPAPPPAAPASYEDLPLSPIRAAIARQMTQSKGPVPHFYIATEIAMDRAVALREELQALPGAPPNVKLTFTDLIVRACALALSRHPGVNASFQEGGLRRFRGAHIGIAVALAEGLITPVLRDCDQKTLFRIAADLRDLVERARARKLRAQELGGATFSVSNLGMFPVDEFSAIINPPEGAILAVGAILDKPVAVDGQLAIGKRMRVTLSCDHRVMDGAMGARFLADLKSLLEAPLSLLV